MSFLLGGGGSWQRAVSGEVLFVIIEFRRFLYIKVSVLGEIRGRSGRAPFYPSWGKVQNEYYSETFQIRVLFRKALKGYLLFRKDWVL